MHAAQRVRVVCATAPASSGQAVALLQAGSLASEIKVDRAGRLIQNVAFLTAGRASGNLLNGGGGIEFLVDQTSLEQVVALINARPQGVKSRFTHPELAQGMFTGLVDDIEFRVGRGKNARIVDDQVRGDIAIAKYADNSPRGHLGTYLMDLAEDEPGEIGMSLSFLLQLEASPSGGDLPVARFISISAVDFVGEPGGNPRGLLHQPRPPAANQGEPQMDPKLIMYLKSIGLKGDQKTRAEAIARGESPPAADPPAPAAVAEPAAAAAAIALAERQRVKAIRGLASQYRLDDEWADTHIDQGVPFEACRVAALEAYAQSHQPVHVAVGEDRNRQSLGPAITDAVLLRGGARVENPHERAQEFRGLGLCDMARRFLVALGIPGAETMSRMAVARTVLSRAAMARYVPETSLVGLSMSTSDFPNLLAASAQRILRSAYAEAPVTWNRWAARGTAPDLRQQSLIQLSGAPGLLPVPEGAEYQAGYVKDTKEVVTLAKYGRMLLLTLEALINDDLGGFLRLPRSMGAACRRMEDDVAYAPLTANQVMTEDGKVLFISDHGNLAGTPAALSVASLSVGRAALRKQKDANGAVLNLAAKHLLVPVALETTAEQLIGSVVDPAKSNATVNPFANKLQITAEPRLDVASATAWCLAADSNLIDTVMILFLEDEPEPTIEEEDSFDTDARKYKARHFVAGRAVDFRGVFKNAGA